MTRQTKIVGGIICCLVIALFIILARAFDFSSSPTEKALKEAEYNEFKTQTTQLLSTLKEGDLLSMDGGKSYMFVKFITGNQLHLYSINNTMETGLHYSTGEMINLYGKREYSIIRSDDPNWKVIVLQQLLQ